MDKKLLIKLLFLVFSILFIYAIIRIINYDRIASTLDIYIEDIEQTNSFHYWSKGDEDFQILSNAEYEYLKDYLLNANWKLIEDADNLGYYEHLHAGSDKYLLVTKSYSIDIISWGKSFNELIKDDVLYISPFYDRKTKRFLVFEVKK